METSGKVDILIPFARIKFQKLEVEGTKASIQVFFYLGGCQLKR